jgi:hypothetical protein
MLHVHVDFDRGYHPVSSWARIIFDIDQKQRGAFSLIGPHLTMGASTSQPNRYKLVTPIPEASVEKMILVVGFTMPAASGSNNFQDRFGVVFVPNASSSKNGFVIDDKPVTSQFPDTFGHNFTVETYTDGPPVKMFFDVYTSWNGAGARSPFSAIAHGIESLPNHRDLLNESRAAAESCPALTNLIHRFNRKQQQPPPLAPLPLSANNQFVVNQVVQYPPAPVPAADNTALDLRPRLQDHAYYAGGTKTIQAPKDYKFWNFFGDAYLLVRVYSTRVRAHFEVYPLTKFVEFGKPDEELSEFLDEQAFVLETLSQSYTIVSYRNDEALQEPTS